MKKNKSAKLVGKLATALLAAILALSVVACARDVYVERTELPSIDDKKAE